MSNLQPYNVNHVRYGSQYLTDITTLHLQNIILCSREILSMFPQPKHGKNASISNIAYVSS